MDSAYSTNLETDQSAKYAPNLLLTLDCSLSQKARVSYFSLYQPDFRESTRVSQIVDWRSNLLSGIGTARGNLTNTGNEWQETDHPDNPQITVWEMTLIPPGGLGLLITVSFCQK